MFGIFRKILIYFSVVAGYGYGHPGAFNPFLLNPGWLDAAYLNYAWADYFRPPQIRDQNPLVKGIYLFLCYLII